LYQVSPTGWYQQTISQTVLHLPLQVWKIEDFLAKWESSCSGASGSDPGKAAIALVLLQEIDTYR
jgi:hypothetical protein